MSFNFCMCGELATTIVNGVPYCANCLKKESDNCLTDCLEDCPHYPCALVTAKKATENIDV